LCLLQKTAAYFAGGGRLPLTYYEKMEFVSFWYLLIIFNDFLTIVGSVLKILIENKVSNFLRGFFSDKLELLLVLTCSLVFRIPLN